MAVTNKFFKPLLKNHVSFSALDFFKRIYLQRQKFSYNKILYSRVKAILKSRNALEDVLIADDLNLLHLLHNIFPRNVVSLAYDHDALIHRARARFDLISGKGISLHGLDVLDIGAGHGENLMVCNEYGFRSATGIDYSSDSYKNHTVHLGFDLIEKIKFIEGDLFQVEFERESHDFIISINSFEHFRDPGAVIDKCFFILRRGGYLYIDFGPLFRSPYGAHRYGNTGIPYIQNIFSEDVAYQFFYRNLKIISGEEINRYTGEKITNGDPYPEMNKWTVSMFEKLFLSDERWRIIEFRKGWNYKEYWMTRLFRNELKTFTHNDLFVSHLFIIFQKK